MQICNVVVGLGDQHPHVVPFTVRSGLDIDAERSGELIETDMTNSNVAESDGNVLGLTQALKLAIGAFVQLQRVLESVLTVVDVSQVQVEPCQTQAIAILLENLPSFFCP